MCQPEDTIHVLHMLLDSSKASLPGLREGHRGHAKVQHKAAHTIPPEFP